MNWPLFRNSLVNCYHEQPQQVARIDHALGLAQEAIRLLAGLGHLCHLAPGPEPSRPEFPRLVFHFQKAPRGFRVLCKQDLELLGDGWYDTLDEAKHADAVEQQHKRGGIFPKIGLPALPQDFLRSRIDQEEGRYGHR